MRTIITLLFAVFSLSSIAQNPHFVKYVLMVPGTTAARPTGSDGIMRYNSTSAKFEAYEDGEWKDVIGGDQTLFGTDNQIPFTNSTGDNFDYSSNLTFSGGTLNVSAITSLAANLELNALSNNIYLDAPGHVEIRGGSGLYIPSNSGAASRSFLGQGVVLLTNANSVNQFYADFNEISFDSETLTASTNLGKIEGSWDGDDVAAILLQSGSDTGNKDDGRMVFQTQENNAGGMVTAMTVHANQTIEAPKLTSNINWTGGINITDALEGVIITSNVILCSRNNTRVSAFRRTGSDGSLMDFWKGDGSTTATNVGSISVTATNTAYNTSSDKRLKSNIRQTEKGIEDLLQIKVRDYKWKSTGEKGFGFVAQELNEIAPYAVTQGETESDMWSVDNSKLVPLLVKSIQDQQQKIEALKTEIENLKKKK